MLVARRILAAWAVILVGPVVGGEWINQADYSSVTVVAPATLPEHEQLAVDTFREYWEKTTGHLPALTPAPADGAIGVYVGKTALPESLAARLPFDKLGTDGVIIHTFSDEGGATERALALGGEGERGTLYAVYDFFDRYMGVRWLAPDVIHIPETPPATLPEIEYRHTPPFPWRENAYHRGYDSTEAGQLYRRAHKFPDRIQWMTWGGHNLFHRVSPEVYFEEHPEYFSEIDGERVAPVGLPWQDFTEFVPDHADKAVQLCMSNPDVARITAESILDELRADPGKLDRDSGIVNVSIMDWAGACTCAECAAIDEYEGSPAGSFMTGLNRIAERVAAEYPDILLQTFAYLHVQKAPKHLQLHPNIAVQFAPIGLDYSRVMGDPLIPENKAALDDLRAWARICKHMHGWEYVVNFKNPNGPHPNLHVIQPNIKLFADNGVDLLFVQGWGTNEPGINEFDWLRAYVVNKAVWNPDEDGDAHMREFVTLYYGAAAPHILEYIELMREHIEDPLRPLYCFNDQGWLTYDLVVRAQELWAQALTATQDDPEVHSRVERAHVAVEDAALVCPPKVVHEGDRIALIRPPSVTLEEHIATLERNGAQARPYEGYFPIKYITERCKGETPSRRQTSPVVKLENARSLVWAAPELQGAIVRWQDKASGVELLQGYEEGSDLHGTIEEWNVAQKEGKEESWVAKAWEVREQSDAKAVFGATMADGLQLEKTIMLDETGAMHYTLWMHNPTNAPLQPNVKIHPEFTARLPQRPEVWVERDGSWSQVKAEELNEAPIAGGPIAPVAFGRWQVWLPGSGVGVLNTFDPSQVGGVFWFYNLQPRREHVNLELLPVGDVLEPGATRTVATRYEVSTARP